ncbi:DISARM system phospholipase D-like protein DrmC [Acidithiobacillus sp. YTS05]|nr:DISARM system phospholipase D-like protein DrmC [Acidithiobacillus sp. YTS05]
MPDDLISALDSLIRKGPDVWLTSAIEALRSLPATATAEFAFDQLPETNNPGLSSLAREAIRLSTGQLSWEALSWALQATHASQRCSEAEHRTEFLWSGPPPAGSITARRIDQALYDLIAQARREILLVTFAATRIERLSGELLKAVQRGVKIRLVLEFTGTSEGQLSFDAMKAFPSGLIESVEIFHWPTSKRDRNQRGKPGRLHAKLAIVDGVALVSSANLTDDAFSRNLELGALIQDSRFVSNAQSHVDRLITDGIFLQTPASA